MKNKKLIESLIIHNGRVRVWQRWEHEDGMTVEGTRTYVEEKDKNLPFKEKRKKKQ